jgi:hypothetical protein
VSAHSQRTPGVSVDADRTLAPVYGSIQPRA